MMIPDHEEVYNYVLDLRDYLWVIPFNTVYEDCGGADDYHIVMGLDTYVLYINRKRNKEFKTLEEAKQKVKHIKTTKAILRIIGITALVVAIYCILTRLF